MKRAVQLLHVGDVLSADVYDSNGCLLLLKGSVMGEGSLRLLNSRNILVVDVEGEQIPLEDMVKEPPKPYEISSNLVEAAINEKSVFKEQYTQGIKAIQNVDIEATKDIAKDICMKMFYAPDIQQEIGMLRGGYDSVLTHSMNVAMITAATIVWLGNMTDEKCYRAVAGAMLHDIGKLYVSRDVLEKPAKLTNDEYEIIKQHAELGYLKLRSAKNVSEEIAQMAYQHHENEDGTGYPLGLKGDSILLESRIIHVADVYEAMTAKRCYKNPILTGDVIEHIMSKYGTMFNPPIVDIFLKAIPAYSRGDIVMLSNYQMAKVTSCNTLNSLRPQIELMQTGQKLNMFTDRNTFNTTITEVIQKNE